MCRALHDIHGLPRMRCSSGYRSPEAVEQAARFRRVAEEPFLQGAPLLHQDIDCCAKVVLKKRMITLIEQDTHAERHISPSTVVCSSLPYIRTVPALGFPATRLAAAQRGTLQTPPHQSARACATSTSEKSRASATNITNSCPIGPIPTYAQSIATTWVRAAGDGRTMRLRRHASP